MNIKEWIDKNINFRREETEVRGNKEYGYTFAGAGLCIGVVTGILLILVQFITSSHDAQQTWSNIIFFAAVALLIAFGCYLLLPLLKSPEIGIGSKVVTVLIALASAGISMIIAIWLVTIVFMVVVAIGVLLLALKVWASSNSSGGGSAPSHHDRPSGPDKYELDDGTIVTDHGFGSYSGSDGHGYDRNMDGSFTRKD
jgi:hypothetical protein